MANLIFTKKGMELTLKWFTFQASPPGTRELMLYKNSYTPGPVSVLANLVEANFGGYLRQPIWGGYVAPYAASPWWQSDAARKYFVCNTGANLPQTIHGYGVVEQGTDLLWVQEFTATVPFTAPGKALSLDHTDRFRGVALGFSGTPAVMTDYGLEQLVRVGTGFSRADTAFQVMLFTNTPTLTPASTLFDLTETSYPGYARQGTGTFGAPFDTTTSQAQFTTVADFLIFTPTGTVSPSQTIVGYGIVGNSTGSLYWAQYFASTTTLNGPADSVFLFPQLNLRSFYQT